MKTYFLNNTIIVNAGGRELTGAVEKDVCMTGLGIKLSLRDSITAI